MPIQDNLFWRRLHSLTGALPLGGFLVFHLYANAWSLNGQLAYNEHIRPLRELPFIGFIEWGFIFLPLLFHSTYGLYIWSSSTANVIQYNYLRNWLYTKQRITGLIALAFIAFHIYDQRLGALPSFEKVAASVTHPGLLAVYLIGIAAVGWHMCNGLWNALIKWGVTIGSRAQTVSLWLFSVMAIGLVAMGWTALSGFLR